MEGTVAHSETALVEALHVGIALDTFVPVVSGHMARWACQHSLADKASLPATLETLSSSHIARKSLLHLFVL